MNKEELIAKWEKELELLNIQFKEQRSIHNENECNAIISEGVQVQKFINDLEQLNGVPVKRSELVLFSLFLERRYLMNASGIPFKKAIDIYLENLSNSSEAD